MDKQQKPEQKARTVIDELLQERYWPDALIDKEEYTGKGYTDYTLYDFAILEAKREKFKGSDDLSIHLQQAEAYRRQKKNTESYPFILVSDGVEHILKDMRSRKIYRLEILPTPLELENLKEDNIELEGDEFGAKFKDDFYYHWHVRPYQEKAIQKTLNYLASKGSEHTRLLLEMAAGTGKTFAALKLIEYYHFFLNKTQGRPVSALYIVDRTMLNTQLLDKDEGYKTLLNKRGIFINDFNTTDKTHVYVATIQTLYSSGSDGQENYRRFQPTDFDLIVVDEAHRSIHGKSWREVVEYYKCPQIGITATPPRAGDRATYEYFGTENELGERVPFFTYKYQTGRDDRYLAEDIFVKPQIYFDDEPYFDEEGKETGYTINGKTYYLKDFGRAVIIHDFDKAIVNLYEKFFYGQKCLVFAGSIKHAESLRNKFEEMFGAHEENHRAELVVSTQGTPRERRNRIEEFKNLSSDLKVIINKNILTAGFNFKELPVIFMARKTLSKSLYLQMKGRGSRLAYDEDGNLIKDSFYLVDFVRNTEWEYKDMEVAITSEEKRRKIEEENWTESDEEPTPREIIEAEANVKIDESAFERAVAKRKKKSAYEIPLPSLEGAEPRAAYDLLKGKYEQDMERLKKEKTKEIRRGVINAIRAAHKFSPYAAITEENFGAILEDYRLSELSKAFEQEFENYQDVLTFIEDNHIQ